MAGHRLMLDGITHSYGGATAVRDVTLDIAPGEMVALLGPSGCGKTTLLKIIGGFVAQSRGRVVIDGQSVDALPANRRRVGIVFQNYALFPHLTVAQNVAYGLEVRGVPRAVRAAKVEEMLALVQISAFADRLPRALSGGQQQRVAIARALAVEPSILLLDEPFAALDKSLRLDMQIEVKRIQRAAGTTTILVTHDQEEALSMADRVAVLSQGRLEQFAPPTEVYDAPASLFVNTFVGSANVLDGAVLASDGRSATIRLDVGGEVTATTPMPLEVGRAARVCLRPESLDVLPADGQSGIPAVVEMGLPLGASIVHELRTPGGVAMKIAGARDAGTAALPPGTAVILRQRPGGAASAFPA